MTKQILLLFQSRRFKNIINTNHPLEIVDLLGDSKLIVKYVRINIFYNYKSW